MFENGFVSYTWIAFHFQQAYKCYIIQNVNPFIRTGQHGMAIFNNDVNVF